MLAPSPLVLLQVQELPVIHVVEVERAVQQDEEPRMAQHLLLSCAPTVKRAPAPTTDTPHPCRCGRGRSAWIFSCTPGRGTAFATRLPRLPRRPGAGIHRELECA